MEKTESTFIDRKNLKLKLILFGGKGGVGKTTCATATALHIARKYPAKRILVFSTDPAHSLSDSFDYKIGEEITQIHIKGLDNLYALEINADKLHEDFKVQHLIELAVIGKKATYFNAKQLPNLFGMSYSSSFSFMALMKFIELIKTNEYDLVILDTAPTGHTLELLQLPKVLRNQIEAMEKSGEMVRYISMRFAGRYRKDMSDRFLEQMKEDVKTVSSVFTNYKKTEFVPVTIPEAMGVYETERLIEGLNKNEIPVRHIVINGVMPEAGCAFCGAIKKDQERYIEEISSEFGNYEIVQMPVFPHEIRGIDGLTEYGEILFGNGKISKKEEQVHQIPNLTAEKEKASVSVSDTVTFTKRQMPEPMEKNLKFILFGGKGGVGKTTCAVATALHIARKYPDKEVLIFSTDPAHSLSDSFDCKIGDEITPILDNLHALEINTEETFADFKKRYREKVNEGFEQKSEGKGSSREGILGTKSRVSHTFDQQTISDLVSAAPLGLDELMALSKTLELKDAYDIVVIDTAPSGHLLGLLQRPEIVKDWFSNIVAGLRSRPYQGGIMETYDVLRLLLEAKKEIRDTETILEDAEKTEFVPVIILEGMSVFETERLLTDLRNLKIQSLNVIANKVVPEGKCSFCTSRRRKQDKYMEDISKRFSEYEITEMPLFPYEIKGMGRLTEFAEVMYGK